jgi:hypothetical protein
MCHFLYQTQAIPTSKQFVSLSALPLRRYHRIFSIDSNQLKCLDNFATFLQFALVGFELQVLLHQTYQTSNKPIETSLGQYLVPFFHFLEPDELH